MPEEYRRPEAGGCWICKTGNGYEDSDMVFDWGFDAFVHRHCLEQNGVENITKYEIEQ